MSDAESLKGEIRVLTQRRDVALADAQDAEVARDIAVSERAAAESDAAIARRKADTEQALAADYEVRRIAAATALDQAHEDALAAGAGTSEDDTAPN